MLSVSSQAQIVTLRGRVTDAKTGELVPGASILSGSFGTSADSSGKFVFYVQQSVIEESGITVRSIGYQTVHITDITENYNVPLSPAIQELMMVKSHFLLSLLFRKRFGRSLKTTSIKVSI